MATVNAVTNHVLGEGNMKSSPKEMLCPPATSYERVLNWHKSKLGIFPDSELAGRERSAARNLAAAFAAVPCALRLSLPLLTSAGSALLLHRSHSQTRSQFGP
jgi:hypothetical protein